MAKPNLALYVHIPFCETKCPYCDFNTYAGIESLVAPYVDALANEIAQWGAALDRPTLSSVFFGGGTPSYLPTKALARLMAAIQTAFDVPSDAEVTAEANPDDCARERLQAMRRAGFNRLSIGVQSLDDNELRMLGRRHSAGQARQAVEAARQAGFDNVSVDLMFGLPYQFVSTWEHTLDEAVALGTEHVSAYALTLEHGTPMEVDVAHGRLPEPNGDLAAEMYRLTQEKLASAGLEQYEVSNWARDGRVSMHNLAYWRNEAYVGVGPGAHGHLFANGLPQLDALGRAGVRYANMRSPRGYVNGVDGWCAPLGLDEAALRAFPAVDSVEALTPRLVRGETMMMGLRLNQGVLDQEFATRFGEGIAAAFPVAVADCIDLGLLEWAEGRLRLTEGGRLVGNEAFQRFLAEGS